jgi:cell division protein DivIC
MTTTTAGARAARGAGNGSFTLGGLSPGARRGALAAVAIAVLALVALLVVGPVQTYREQQADTTVAEAELDELESEIAELDARAAALDDDATIEEIAREEYTLVRPGEEAFALLPQAPAAVPVPQAWPFTSLRLR